MGGRNKQASVNHDADSPAAVPVPEGAFAEEERYMLFFRKGAFRYRHRRRAVSVVVDGGLFITAAHQTHL
jgi:hypothetical protein